MKNYLLICHCILCFAACSVSPTGGLLVIPVDVSQNVPVKLSEISADIKKIELETTETCTIGKIVQVLCDDNRIFVLDSYGGTSIHAFNMSGKYLFSINKQGKGPGEYIGIKNMTIDTENKQIYFVSLGNKILQYDLDGHFIDEYTKAEFPEYVRFENDLIHVFLYAPGRSTGHNTFTNTTVQVRYTRDWQPVDTVLIKSVILSNVVGTVLPNIDFISQDTQNNLFVYYPVLLNEPIVRDTLYILDKNRLKPYAKLKFSDENPKQRNKNIYSISRTSHLLIAEYTSFTDKEKRYFCYDFKSKIGKNMSSGFLDDIFNTGLVEVRLLNSGYFYYVKEVEAASDSTVESNPILHIGKFKEDK